MIWPKIIKGTFPLAFLFVFNKEESWKKPMDQTNTHACVGSSAKQEQGQPVQYYLVLDAG